MEVTSPTPPAGTSPPIIIVGAGAAGIIAAWRAASLGAPVALLERNRKPGIKLLISGGGKCNITHDGPMEELRGAFPPHEARFLRAAFHRFTNTDILALLAAEHVPTFVRPDGRIFPAGGRAEDVVNALVRQALRAGATLRLNVRVTGIKRENQRAAGVQTEAGPIPAAGVIVATGGMSYPKTGTTGDGYRWAAELGHTLVRPAPALAPIGLEPALPEHWRGVAVRGGRLALFVSGRKKAEWGGDILFTHEGISGPAALELSGVAASAGGDAELRYDFFPGKEFPELDGEIRDLTRRNQGKMLGTVMEGLLPNRLIPGLLAGAGVAPETRCAVVTREERRAVSSLLKSWRIGSVGKISLERGEVTAGGIALGEVDPGTMRSRRLTGLYWCGEVLDIAGPVGGYNLQAAFSTGFVAGETAGQDWLLFRSGPAPAGGAGS